ncbi:nitrate/nitrite transporter [Mycobacterium sp.]|uniref:MFS transporter n=1 Tax=Mycobacterium sp. TaxID=1785 RepID=UPI00127A7FC0|nr:nitrate/nitrite transporter [Mycobacterium sp.]KAA8969482.1 MAG: NarK/NasA family nitrate transporter [Mycobacterium sp.]
MPKRRIVDWDPEDAAAWRAGNNRIARRNLIWSIATAHVGFSIWYLWSVMVLFMPQTVYGFSTGDKLLIEATAALVGAAARTPYSMATARFGGRNWAVASSAVLLIPTVGTIFLLAYPGLPLWPYLVCAALTGLGGANYAASLANVEAFYPQRLEGFALGLAGGVANLGAASMQAVGLVVLATAGHEAPYLVCAIYLVLLAIVGVGAALYMDNFPQPIAARDLRSILRVPDTWVIAFLYMCASGSFVGFSFAFGQVMQHSFLAAGQTHGQASLHAAEIAFTGPLVASAARIVGGNVSDRFGGGRVSLALFVGMVLADGFLVAMSGHDDAAHGSGAPTTVFTTIGLVVGFLALFVFAGASRGSVFKLIPSVFEARSRTLDLSDAERRRWARIRSGSLIGLASAFGAFGGVGINLALRQSYASTGSATPAFWVFLAFYVGAAILTRMRYVRPQGELRLS